MAALLRQAKRRDWMLGKVWCYTRHKVWMASEVPCSPSTIFYNKAWAHRWRWLPDVENTGDSSIVSMGVSIAGTAQWVPGGSKELKTLARSYVLWPLLDNSTSASMGLPCGRDWMWTLPVLAHVLRLSGCSLQMAGGSTNEVNVTYKNHWSHDKSFCIYGLIKEVFSYNGYQFVSQDFPYFLKKNGVKCIRMKHFLPSVYKWLSGTIHLDIKKTCKHGSRPFQHRLANLLLKYRLSTHHYTNPSPCSLFCRENSKQDWTPWNLKVNQQLWISKLLKRSIIDNQSYKLCK